TRSLTRAEREADLEAAREADRKPFKELTLADLLAQPVPDWPPILPEEVPRCAVCSLPHVQTTCRGCGKLVARFGEPLSSLDFLTVGTKQEQPESTVWNWKEEAWAAKRIDHIPERWLLDIAWHLSDYLEANQGRLL